MAESRAAWPRALHDGKSNSSSGGLWTEQTWLYRQLELLKSDSGNTNRETRVKRLTLVDVCRDNASFSPCDE